MPRSAAAGRRSASPPAVCLLVPLAFAAPLTAQTADRDGHLPRAGELWIEAAPTFQNWSQVFALDSPDTPDGSREPLAALYDGPVTARLFPGLDPLLSIVNADAGALGFTALTDDDLSMGSLDFGVINIDRREIPFAVTFGLLDRLALEVSAPLVRAHVEAPASFDSLPANLVRAEAAVNETFLSSLADSRAQLQGLVDGGTLTPEDQAAAQELLDRTGDFAAALGSRLDQSGYLFTAGSNPGQQMTALYDGFTAGYGGFGIALPTFALPQQATSEDLDAYFARSPVQAQRPGTTTRGWSLGPIVLGVRVGLLDTFGRPEAYRPTGPVESVPEIQLPADTVRPGPPVSSDDSPEAGDVGSRPAEAAAPKPQARSEDTGAGSPQEVRIQADPVAARAAAEEALARYQQGVRFRTTVGIRYRFAASRPDEDPYLVPSVFLQEPIGTGQAEWELELYQDIQFGSRLLMSVGARYGIRRGDELTRRVAAANRPYALAGQEVVVRRELGDYLYLRASPQVRLADALSLGVEYSLWSKRADAYSAAQEGAIDPSPLAGETKETRHRLGIGIFYRTTARHALGLASLPVELAFIYQTAIAGSGGRTPASEIVTGSLRFPVRLF